MTQVGGSLDLITPNHGEMGGDMRLAGVEAMHGHENEGIEKGNEGEKSVDHADAGEES